MSDIHALSGAYAVDALDDDERVEFEEHLAVCAECRAEVASFRETGALIAETEAVEPPASLRAGVLSGISQIRPLHPSRPHCPSGSSRPARPSYADDCSPSCSPRPRPSSCSRPALCCGTPGSSTIAPTWPRRS